MNFLGGIAMKDRTQKIVSHLWFDKQSYEAAEFYTSLFPDSKITNMTTIHDTPSGDPAIVSFRLWGQEFMAIDGGPHFKFNPAVSFSVNFDVSHYKDAPEMINEVWDKLSDGGTVLMPFDNYPFAEKYGWIQDKYGLSWQLILTDSGEERPSILPSLLFIDHNYGHAEAAIQFYLSIFKNSTAGQLARYPAGMDPDKEGTVMFADFMLENQWFTAMDSANAHEFNFNEAISFLVKCDTQDEIDYYWEKLSAVPESEQCGWLKDKYGVSWQIVSGEMDDMMGSNSTPEQIARVTQTMLKMKKIDVEALRKAYNMED